MIVLFAFFADERLPVLTMDFDDTGALAAGSLSSVDPSPFIFIDNSRKNSKKNNINTKKQVMIERFLLDLKNFSSPYLLIVFFDIE
jgi:hypothetical protein